MHKNSCLCAQIPDLQLGTRLALVMHCREVEKTTATGPLALAALQNSELYVHGLKDSPLDLNHLHEEGRRVMVLFPSERARPLDQALEDDDTRPITLVVPDGNWRQASRVPKRIAGLERAEAVTLPPGPPTRWGLRRETRASGLATFEAIARSFGLIESIEVQTQLEAIFDKMVETSFAARGYDRDGAPNGKEVLLDSGELPKLDIVYEDEFLVAINKPSGLLVHKGWGNDELPVLQRLRDQIERRLFPIHRLDRATSGVLLFALTSEFARDMQVLFDEQNIKKRYLALCRGNGQLARVDHSLAREKGEKRKPAQTDFRLLGQFERYGLYEARPLTGRTHQIRRHLKHVSHPIVGDVRYGKGEHNRIFRNRFDFHRLALHCESMSFCHPRSGESLRVRAPLPEDFSNLLEQLKLSTCTEMESIE